MRLEELSIAPYRVTVPRGIDGGRTRGDRARFAIRRRGGIRDAAFPRFLLHRYPPCFAIVIIGRRDLRFCAIAATGVIPDVIPERRPSAKAPQLRASSGLFGSHHPNVVRRATQATRPDCSPPSVRYDRFASANSGRSVSAFKRGCEVRPEGRPRVIQNFVRRYFNSQRTEPY